MRYPKGAIVLLCFPILLAMAMSLLAIWNHIAFQQRLVRAERQVLEAKKVTQEYFQKWEQILRQRMQDKTYKLQETWEEPCAESAILRCGYKLINQESILAYVKLSGNICRERLLHFQCHTRGGEQDGCFKGKDSSDHWQ